MPDTHRDLSRHALLWKSKHFAGRFIAQSIRRYIRHLKWQHILLRMPKLFRSRRAKHVQISSTTPEDGKARNINSAEGCLSESVSAKLTDFRSAHQAENILPILLPKSFSCAAENYSFKKEGSFEQSDALNKRAPEFSNPTMRHANSIARHRPRRTHIAHTSTRTTDHRVPFAPTAMTSNLSARQLDACVLGSLIGLLAYLLRLAGSVSSYFSSNFYDASWSSIRAEAQVEWMHWSAITGQAFRSILRTPFVRSFWSFVKHFWGTNEGQLTIVLLFHICALLLSITLSTHYDENGSRLYRSSMHYDRTVNHVLLSYQTA